MASKEAMQREEEARRHFEASAESRRSQIERETMPLGDGRLELVCSGRG